MSLDQETYESLEMVKAEQENTECFIYVLGQFGLWLEDRKDRISKQCYNDVLEAMLHISLTTLLDKTLIIKCAALTKNQKDIDDFRHLLTNKKHLIDTEVYDKLIKSVNDLEADIITEVQ
jgi:hypothetical protein